MKFAAIDLGTNSTRLLIANFSGTKILPIVREMHITRLGKNIASKGFIGLDGQKKTCKVLSSYMEKIRKNDVGLFKAVGTAALRDAKNKKEFLLKAREDIGLDIEIISARQEACYSFKGAVCDLKDSPLYTGKRIVLADLGGGSSEFIGGYADQDDKVFKSIGLGCVTLTEMFLRTDPPAQKEIIELREHVRAHVERDLKIFLNDSNFTLVGVAGTVAAIASMQKNLMEYDRDRIHHSVLKYEDVSDICNRLIKVDLSERKRIIGLEKKRADIIIAGTLMLLEVMKFFQKEKIIVSESDILDGIIYSLAKI
jgi:exopolyphosphatase / guanosine-5'-triphosphate,3'-diphosphate pyrophosphatase